MIKNTQGEAMSPEKEIEYHKTTVTEVNKLSNALMEGRLALGLRINDINKPMDELMFILLGAIQRIEERVDELQGLNLPIQSPIPL